MTDQNAAQREWAATEKRKWVRTIRACNNRCMFCLDSGMLDGFVVPPEEVQREIRQGREEGCQRLILSGGEASIHPRFLDFVAYGREQGYGWIQTITNGRLFSYGKFARRAAQAGLNEVTFSVHGHTPELADELTGVSGSFEQSLKGLLNVRRLGLVANIDIVLNRMNIPHLKDMLDFFEGLGIHEFDLLWLVPFGRGFDRNRDKLFISPEEAFPHIQRALEGRRRPGLYLWTNRFPVQHLEGYEWLIQEPYKLFDEVNGRRDMFAQFAREGEEALGCRGERCTFCFMEQFCDVILDYRTRATTPDDGGFRMARLDLTTPSDTERTATFGAALGDHPIQRLELEATTVDEAEAALASLGATPPPVALRVDEADGLASLASRDTPLGAALAVLVVHDAALVDTARALADARPELALELEANAQTESTLEGLAGSPPALPFDRLTVVLRNHDRLSKVEAHGLSPERVREALAALPPESVAVRNLPACLAGGQRLDEAADRDREPDVLVPGLLDDDGNIDPFGFTERFIVGHYYAKSLRCGGCPVAARCRGAHINTLRAYGFGILQPARVSSTS